MTRSFLPAALVLLILVVSVPALASDLRIYAMGDLSWVVDDDLDHFINPANAAWAKEGYLSLKGRYNTAKYSVDSEKATYGSVYFIKPGAKSVHGGWATLVLTRNDYNSAGYPYEYEKNEVSFNLQEAIRLGDRFALGGSVTVQPMPGNRTYRYDDGDVSEYKDKGVTVGGEGAFTGRLGDKLTIEGVLGYDLRLSGMDRYLNGTFDSFYRYRRDTLSLKGKAALALTDRAKAVAIVARSYNNEADDGAGNDWTTTEWKFGGAAQATDQLLLGGAVEFDKTKGSVVTYTTLRGGAEYQLSKFLALRGGVAHYSRSESSATRTDLTLGAGLGIGSGSLDLYGLLGTTSGGTDLTALQAAYTMKF